MTSLVLSSTDVNFSVNSDLTNEINKRKKDKLDGSFIKKLIGESDKDKSNINDEQQMVAPRLRQQPPTVESMNNMNKIHENEYGSLDDDEDTELQNFYRDELHNDKNKVMKKLALEAEEKNRVAQHYEFPKITNSGIDTDTFRTFNGETSHYGYNRSNGGSSNDELLDRVNYLIGMFEDQREIRTTQKNEEIVLYSFMGIFIIYVLDSFVHVGKYTR